MSNELKIGRWYQQRQTDMADFALLTQNRIILVDGEPENRTLQQWDEEFRAFCAEDDSEPRDVLASGERVGVDR